MGNSAQAADVTTLELTMRAALERVQDFTGEFALTATPGSFDILSIELLPQEDAGAIADHRRQPR